MNQQDHKTRIIYTSFVADLLIEWGEKFLHIRPDFKDPQKNVFVFKNSPTFTEKLSEAIKKQYE